MPARISVEDKERLLNAYQKGDDYQDLARQLGIKRTTAWAIIHRAILRHGVVALPRGGRRHHKIHDEDIRNVLVEIVEEHATYTLEQIKMELQQRLPHKPVLSVSSVARCLTGQLIFLKKAEDSPAERNSLRTKELRCEYAQWFLNEGVATELVFIDESGINLWVRRTRGRARRGERAVRVVGGQRGRNFTVVFAISTRRGLIHHDIFEGGMTINRFHTFLQETSATSDEPLTYIYDNATCHGHAQRQPQDGGPQIPVHHRRKSLPPYSPFLNIVEMAFSAFKACLKRHLENVRQQLLQQPQPERLATLVQLAEQSIEVVTLPKCTAWLAHTQRYLPGCLAQEDILM